MQLRPLLGRRFHLNLHGPDEIRISEDPLVRDIRLASSPECTHRGPATGAPHQAPALKVWATTLEHARLHERPVGFPRPPDLGREATEDSGGRLPRPKDVPK
jgi:hypothetical protein